MFPEDFMEGEVFLGRSVEKEKLTALASQRGIVFWNKSTGMSLVSDSVFLLSDQECLQVCPEKLSCCRSSHHVHGAPERSFCCGYLVFAFSRRTENSGDFYFPS